MLALTIHEGIEGYRDESIDATIELTEDLSIRHEVVSYEEEFDVQMDDVVESDPENMAACAYCGVFRRDLLEKYAAEFDADKLLTGHNLDDEAQTAMMNFLEGDVRQVAKHFDASLGPFDERGGGTDAFVRAPNRSATCPKRRSPCTVTSATSPTHMAGAPTPRRRTAARFSRRSTTSKRTPPAPADRSWRPATRAVALARRRGVPRGRRRRRRLARPRRVSAAARRRAATSAGSAGCSSRSRRPESAEPNYRTESTCPSRSSWWVR